MLETHPSGGICHLNSSQFTDGNASLHSPPLHGSGFVQQGLKLGVTYAQVSQGLQKQNQMKQKYVYLYIYIGREREKEIVSDGDEREKDTNDGHMHMSVRALHVMANVGVKEG